MSNDAGEFFAKEEDRWKVPTLDQSQIIKVEPTKLAELFAPIAAGIGVLVAGVLAAIGLAVKDLKGTPAAVSLGVCGAIVLTALGAWAAIAVADLKSRAAVTVANLELRRRSAPLDAGGKAASPDATTTSSAGKTSDSPSSMRSEALWVKLLTDEDAHLVIGASEAPGNKVRYLVTKGADTPAWIDEDEIASYDAPRRPTPTS